MLKFVLLVSFLVGAYGAPPLPTLVRNEERIIGGEPTEIIYVPWQAAALYDGGGVGSYLIRCGATIVSETAIITAAQCVKGTDVSLWKIRVASKYFTSGGHVVDVSKYKMHENYYNMDYDIAIIWLATPLNFNEIHALPVTLPKQGDTVADGSIAYMTGWGSTTGMGGYSSVLRSVNIPIISKEACSTVYGGLTDRMICAGQFQVACNGDEGGPLIYQRVLIGIASFGRCATKNVPGVYAYVPSMMDWVEQQLA